MSGSAEVIIKAGETPAETPANAAEYKGPAYIPEKFRSAEDPAKAMADAYAELEKKLSTPAEKTDAEKAAEAEAAKAAAAEKAKTDKGAQPDPAQAKAFDPFFQEFEKDGKLSDDSYAKLETMGLSRDVVDAYVAGQQSLAAAAGTELKASVGGDEVYDAMLTWGQTGLTEAERTAYDNVLASGNMQAAKTMAAALVAKFKDATGVDPSRQIGGDRTNNTTARYNNRDEMIRDMAKPQYRSDPAFQKEVEAKALRSDF